MEDIDTTRSRPEYEAAIYEDLRWLGLQWEEPVRKQSEHFAEYRAALKKLESLGVLYPCFCTRREIQEEIARAGQAPHGPDGPAVSRHVPEAVRRRSERAHRRGTRLRPAS